LKDQEKISFLEFKVFTEEVCSDMFLSVLTA